jgi:formylglycine-generating enzyme required for sulfatase activity
MNHDVFISYSSKNKQTADAICHVLERNKIKCWIAPRDISIGEKYGDVIERAIRSCKVFIIVFSKESSLSPWVESELNLAFTDQRAIMPFRIDQAELQGEMRLILNNKHWIDAYPNPAKHFADLISAVARQIGINVSSSVDDSNKQKKQYKTCPNKVCNRTGLPSEAIFCPDCGSRSENKLQKTEFSSVKEKTDFKSFTEIVYGERFDMIAVEGSSFLMGSPIKEPERSNDEQQHKETVDDFYIGKFVVTQALWIAIMGNNNGFLTKLFGGSGGFITNDPNLPIDNVSWMDCFIFIQRLNYLTGKKYSLPTEVQWEFAARGGRKSNGYTYSGSNNIEEVAWYRGNCTARRMHVGRKKANELDISDMSGNVMEWCADLYSAYRTNHLDKPITTSNITSRVCRGGETSSSAANCRVAKRYTVNEYYSRGGLGFRLVLST